MHTTTISKIYDILAETYPLFEDSDDEWMKNGLSDTPFRALISVALSTMTNGPRTIKAAVGLFDKVSTFEEIRDLPDDELRDIIRSVAHYNRKTLSLKEMSRQILRDHGGEIPTTHVELMQLRGIGRKCADIMMNFQYGTPTVAVDTHVHRVVNRLGMVHTSTHEQTADALTDATPDSYKQHAHEWLIQHGMKTCIARKPKCQECPLQ
ncbi:endonuclease III domain-containing protein [Arthrobacter sp. Hz1]